MSCAHDPVDVLTFTAGDVFLKSAYPTMTHAAVAARAAQPQIIPVADFPEPANIDVRLAGPILVAVYTCGCATTPNGAQA